MSSSDLSDSVAINRDVWTRSNASYTDRTAADAWAQDEMTWGTWTIPDSQVGALPDVNGLDVVELGCGTAYFSAWFAKRGARPVGVDPTPAQLATARRLQAETGIEFHLSHGDWIRLLRANGFEILDLIELQAPADAVTHAHYDFVEADWAKQWPSEEIWVARKRG